MHRLGINLFWESISTKSDVNISSYWNEYVYIKIITFDYLWLLKTMLYCRLSNGFEEF